jgi:hypothetical protein
MGCPVDMKAVLLLEVMVLSLSLPGQAGPGPLYIGGAAAAVSVDANDPMPAGPNEPAPTDPNQPAYTDPNESAQADPNEQAQGDPNQPATTEPNEPAGQEDYFDMSLEELMEVEVAAAALTPAGVPADAVATVVADEANPVSDCENECLNCGVSHGNGDEHSHLEDGVDARCPEPPSRQRR